MPGQVTHFYLASRVALAFPENHSDETVRDIRNGIHAWMQANAQFNSAAHLSVKEKNRKMISAAMAEYRRVLLETDSIAIFSAFAAGAVGPDLWVIPDSFGGTIVSGGNINGEWYFDLGHYNISHAFPVHSLVRIKQLQASLPTIQNKYRKAYILGYLSHISLDILAHLQVNVFAGAYHQQQESQWETEQSSAWIALETKNVLKNHNKIEHYLDAYVRFFCFEGWYADSIGYRNVLKNHFGQNEPWKFPNYTSYYDGVLDYPGWGNEISNSDELFLDLSTSLPAPFAHRYRTDGEKRVQPFARQFFWEAYENSDPWLRENNNESLTAVTDEYQKLEFFRFNMNNTLTSQFYYLQTIIPNLEKVNNFTNRFYAPELFGAFIQGAIPIASGFIDSALKFLNDSTPLPQGEMPVLRKHVLDKYLPDLRNWNLDTGLALRIKELKPFTAHDGIKHTIIPVCIDLVHVADLEYVKNSGWNIPMIDKSWHSKWSGTPKVRWVYPDPEIYTYDIPSNTITFSGSTPKTIRTEYLAAITIRVKNVSFHEEKNLEDIHAYLFGNNERANEPWVIHQTDGGIFGDDSDDNSGSTGYALGRDKIDSDTTGREYAYRTNDKECIESFDLMSKCMTIVDGKSLGRSSRVYSSTFWGGDKLTAADENNIVLKRRNRPMCRHFRISTCRKWICRNNDTGNFDPDMLDIMASVFPTEDIVISLFALEKRPDGAYKDLFHEAQFTEAQVKELQRVKIVGVNSIVLIFTRNNTCGFKLQSAWIDGEEQTVEKDTTSNSIPQDQDDPVDPIDPVDPVDPDKPERVRVIGMSFDTSKSFILPKAMNGIREMVKLYNKYPESELLVVGHTDTAGKPSYNDPLSLERAESVAAFLCDKVDAWLAWYKSSVTEKKWGKTEDDYMLKALPDYSVFSTDPRGVVWGYQKKRGLSEDGVCGTDTRRQLITDYMALDGTSLPSGISPTTHGCGESFPEVATGDNTANDDNRRVELFVFPKPTGGITPKPKNKISKPGDTEYPEWKSKTPNPIDVRV